MGCAAHQPSADVELIGSWGVKGFVACWPARSPTPPFWTASKDTQQAGKHKHMLISAFLVFSV
jgi:hypothetical protein